MRIALVTDSYTPHAAIPAGRLEHLVRGLEDRGHRLEIVDSGSLVALYREWRHDAPDLIHVTTDGPLGRAAILVARWFFVPVTSSFVGDLRRGRPWRLRYLRLLHGLTARTFAPSEAQARRLVQAGFRDVAVSGHGVDTRFFSPAHRDADLRRRWDAGTGTPVALYVGGLAAECNLPLALRAYRAMKERRGDLRLVLVGDGPLRDSLRRDPDLHFAGSLHGEELARHYASCDLILLPTTTETFGVVTTEAMSSGLTVLAYDCAAAAEYIAAGRNGLVVAPGDEVAFLAAAVEWADGRHGRTGLGREARATASRLSRDGVIDRLEDAFQEVSTSRDRVPLPAGR